MRIAVDFHVHVYPQFSQGWMFDRIAERSLNAGCSSAILFLTERADCNWYQLNQSPENGAAMFVHNGVSIRFVPGFQVVTCEGIEVHALSTAVRPAEGLTLEQTVEQIEASDGVVMLGWGAGKWLGERGQVISDFMRSERGAKVCLGDSRHRPLGWPTPSQFTGRVILNGSDPLPLRGEENSLLSFGNVYDLPLSGVDHLDPKQLFSIKPSAVLGRRLDPFRFAMLQGRIRF